MGECRKCLSFIVGTKVSNADHLVNVNYEEGNLKCFM